MIKVKRAYEQPTPQDGVRFLVDRLWPRGVTRDSLKIEAWLKDASPSNELRKLFHGKPDKWDEFCRRYFAELKENPESWAPIVNAANEGDVTLVYGARDTERNNAVALRDFLIHAAGLSTSD